MEETAQKFCRGCGRWLALRKYSFKNQARGVLRSQCRACCRERSRRHYERQESDYLKRNRRRRPLLRRRAAQAVLEYLQQHPCAGCGERAPAALQLCTAVLRGDPARLASAGPALRWAAPGVDRADR
jgi:hypothetical protein